MDIRLARVADRSCRPEVEPNTQTHTHTQFNRVLGFRSLGREEPQIWQMDLVGLLWLRLRLSV